MKKVRDHYFKLAKKQNYSARSVFKLEEIDKKYHLIKKGKSVLDLGASPGSWSEYTLKRLEGKGTLVSVDLKPLQTKSAHRLTFIQCDIAELYSSPLLNQTPKFNLILSDMAPNTTGNKGLNHQLSLDLCREVLKTASHKLKRHGNLVCKIFQGEDFHDFIIHEAKPLFESYKLFKPKSTRKESVEIFLIGFNYTQSV